MMRFGELFRRVWISPATADNERVYAIGDVHGRIDLLRHLIKQIEADVGQRGRRSTRIVLLGDLIDRGPASRQVLELVRAMQLQNDDRIVVLCGNHEQLLLASADGNADAQRVWIENGGQATLRSYGLTTGDFMALSPQERGNKLWKSVGPQVLAWLAALPCSFRSGDYFFCHAGVRPKIALSKQRREDLLWIRRDFLESDRFHGAVIVHGHSETDAVETRRNRINVDTGAYRSNRLTAVGLDGRYRWFVSSDEKYLTRGDLEAASAGRNASLLG